jgi:hypothetical protein
MRIASAHHYYAIRTRISNTLIDVMRIRGKLPFCCQHSRVAMKNDYKKPSMNTDMKKFRENKWHWKSTMKMKMKMI